MSETANSPSPPNPLSHLHAYLKDIKTCLALLSEILVEFKNVLVVITMIAFFVFGVYEALSRLLSPQSRTAEQTVSRPFDQDHK